MRTWTVLFAFLCGGCLEGVIPGHDPSPTPTPASDPAPDPAPAPAPAGSVSGRDGLDAGTQALAPSAIVLESEAATLTAPMTTQSDLSASGNQYILVPAGGVGGKAVFTFQLPAEADYAIWGRVAAGTDSNNSFHVSIDGDLIDNDATDGSSTIWDLPVSVAWTWSHLNMRVAVGNQDLVEHLAAGKHTLYLNQREVLSALDQIIVTPDLAYVPN